MQIEKKTFQSFLFLGGVADLHPKTSSMNPGCPNKEGTKKPIKKPTIPVILVPGFLGGVAYIPKTMVFVVLR